LETPGQTGRLAEQGAHSGGGLLAKTRAAFSASGGKLIAFPLSLGLAVA